MAIRVCAWGLYWCCTPPIKKTLPMALLITRHRPIKCVCKFSIDTELCRKVALSQDKSFEPHIQWSWNYAALRSRQILGHFLAGADTGFFERGGVDNFQRARGLGSLPQKILKMRCTHMRSDVFSVIFYS